MKVLASMVVLVACSGSKGANDEAIARYANQGSGTTEVAAAPVHAQRVSVTVERAKGPDMDPGPGTSDFYVSLSYEGQRFRTSVVEGSETPSWGDSTVFDLVDGGVLEVTLLDEDSLSSDEKLGIKTLVLPPLAVNETQTLEVKFTGERAGEVVLTLTGMRRP